MGGDSSVSTPAAGAGNGRLKLNLGGHASRVVQDDDEDDEQDDAGDSDDE